jgi:hypothetical protein
VAGFEPTTSSSRTIGGKVIYGRYRGQRVGTRPARVAGGRYGCCTPLLCRSAATPTTLRGQRRSDAGRGWLGG